jgi:hypothetical protein
MAHDDFDSLYGVDVEIELKNHLVRQRSMLQHCSDPANRKKFRQAILDSEWLQDCADPEVFDDLEVDVFDD